MYSLSCFVHFVLLLSDICIVLQMYPGVFNTALILIEIVNLGLYCNREYANGRSSSSGSGSPISNISRYFYRVVTYNINATSPSEKFRQFEVLFQGYQDDIFDSITVYFFDLSYNLNYKMDYKSQYSTQPTEYRQHKKIILKRGKINTCKLSGAP